MGRIDFLSIAGIILVQAERRNQQSSINPDCSHCRHHIVSGDFIRALKESVPRTSRMVLLVGVDLYVNRGRLSSHLNSSLFSPKLPSQSGCNQIISLKRSTDIISSTRCLHQESSGARNIPVDNAQKRRSGQFNFSYSNTAFASYGVEQIYSVAFTIYRWVS